MWAYWLHFRNDKTEGQGEEDIPQRSPRNGFKLNCFFFFPTESAAYRSSQAKDTTQATAVTMLNAGSLTTMPPGNSKDP